MFKGLPATPQVPFHRAFTVFNSGSLRYKRGELGGGGAGRPCLGMSLSCTFVPYWDFCGKNIVSDPYINPNPKGSMYPYSRYLGLKVPT